MIADNDQLAEAMESWRACQCPDLQEEIISRYVYPIVRSVVLSGTLPAGTEADDVIQDAVMRVVRSFNRIDPKRRPFAFVARIAHREVARARQRHSSGNRNDAALLRKAHECERTGRSLL
jgi:DNA-directed RNA polymerase specialized sigma24 family protein